MSENECPYTGKACITMVTLQDHLESRLDSIEHATELASRALNARLELLNEFRAQLKDQTASFVTRLELEAVREQIASLKESRAELAGKASATSVMVAQLLGLAGLVVGVLSLLLGRGL